MCSDAQTKPVPRLVRFAPGWPTAWFLVFAANLPFPFWCAFELNDDLWFRSGVVVAVLALLVLGYLEIAPLPSVRRAVVCGGIVVALSQLCPVLHLFVAIVSAVVVGHLPVTGCFGRGFWLTIFTGGQFLTVACVVGALPFWPGAGDPDGSAHEPS
jgi:hypothetical protein